MVYYGNQIKMMTNDDIKRFKKLYIYKNKT